MDKNLKAELVALRDEVIRNLKNIENVVDDIDTKLKNDDEVAALTKCPKLESLLSQCKNIKWDPSASDWDKRNLENTVKSIEELMSTPLAERYVALCANIVGASRNLDRVMGRMPEKSSMENFWDEVRQKNVHPLDESNKEEVEEENPPLEVKLALDRMNLAIKKQENPQLAEMLANNPEGVEIGFAPEWAKNVGTKNMGQILKEASEWDELSQDTFIKMWNSNKKRRIAVLKEALEDVVIMIKSISYQNQSAVTSLDDANRVANIYKTIDQYKTSIIDLIQTHNTSELADILEHDNDDNFIKYYDWLSSLSTKLATFHDATPIFYKNILTDRCGSILSLAIVEHEKRVPEGVIFDKDKFDFVPMPPDQKASYEKVAYNNYIKDLEQAYKWVFANKSAEVTEAA